LHHGGVGGATTRTFGITGDGTPQTANFVFSNSDAKIGSVKISPTWMELYKPDVLVLMLGVNDIISNPKRDVGEIADALATLLRLASNESPKTRCYVSSIVESGPAYYTEQATALNAELRSRAGNGAFKGTSFVDGCAMINRRFRSDGIKSVTIDGTHPNDLGYSLIAGNLAAGIRVASPAKEQSMSSGAKVALATFGGLIVYKAIKSWWG
jgi:lysophospholipase L1-like esterase